ncbi:phosphatidylinositol-specific phospholipase C/glycerophosphodiester phosphodiesterase family protein [Mucilaginibacter sp.]|uniref:phosphatidylinositol-specific phospholipase C/glycerophosphodiester phosphodiesterase family protein n=1 Tax=Mucilaginibacter sp. TaxID=1882438 RepID=UPI0035BC393F
MIFRFKRALFLLLILIGAHTAVCAQTVLENAFAHNDYKHKRPLSDALDYGIGNIEADIFLHKGNLTVAHLLPFFRKGKTLENLYLRPLFERFAIQESIYSGYSKPVILMIDIKSDADKTYIELAKQLDKYRSILTSYEDGIVTERAVTVIISGHKPYELMARENLRYAFIDDDLKKSRSGNFLSDLCLMASAKYSKILNWNGKKPITTLQKEKLCKFVNNAHIAGEKVRLWAIPQNPAVWATLMDCGVDLINSDNLAGMKTFFDKKK